MNVFTQTPVEIIAFVMSELHQVKRNRMVFIDSRGNMDVLRADSIAGQQRWQRTPQHWIGTWDGRAGRTEVAYRIFSEVARLVQPRSRTPRRGVGPRGPWVAGSMPVDQQTLPLRGAA